MNIGVCALFAVTSFCACTLDVTMDIYLPRHCSELSAVYNTTVETTLDFISTSRCFSSIRIKSVIFDTCDINSALNALVERVGNHSIENHVVIGPGVHDFCEPATRLANVHNKTLLSHSCTQKELASFPSLQHHLRSVPASDVTAIAITQLLRHFLWKYVAIVASTRSECWTFVKDTYYELTSAGFVVNNVIEIGDDSVSDAVARQLETIGSHTKGRCTSVLHVGMPVATGYVPYV